MTSTLLWFRRDLRLGGNPALAWAARRGLPLAALYIHDPEGEAPWVPGGASRWWLHHSLLHLGERLAAQGVPLNGFRGSAEALLPRLAQAAGADTVVANRLYEPHLQARDEQVRQRLAASGVAFRLCDDGLFAEPGTLLNRQGAPFRVFTPFWNALQRRLLEAPPAVVGEGGLPACVALDGGVGVDGLELLDEVPWHTKLHAHWVPGEVAAWQRLEAFADGPFGRYATARDLPAEPGTSRLSPHLHFGEISVAQVRAHLIERFGEGGRVEPYLRQLAWREFAAHLLWHFPHTVEAPLDARFESRMWRREERLSAAWRRGESGIPLVDAGMHELWQSGWMHNRVRMVAGSLLTKNLGLHWLEGARWFWETLVDADLANNTLGWQWIAGCGADAAPYFRIFNPHTQAERFDPQGIYRRRWLGGRPGPAPVVDLKASREAALERYRRLVQRKGIGPRRPTVPAGAGDGIH
ncbi:cryptochrome/photolyase family protein [Endothiovibrio diazotrophicus]